MSSNDLLSITVTYPPELVSTVTGGILLAFTPPRGKLRTMDRDLPGVGSMIHFLGPAPRLYSASIRLESTTFEGLETKDEAWGNIENCLCTVTVTPRTDGGSNARKSQLLTNMLATIREVYPPISSGDQFSRTITMDFKQVTPVGVP
jgi:hypothetical protein